MLNSTISSFSEQAKYNVAKTIYAFVSICFILIAFLNYFGQIIFFYQALSALVLSSLSLLYIVITKKYKIAIFVTIIVSFFEHLIGFLTESADNDQTNLFWILNFHHEILLFQALPNSYQLL